MKEMLKPMVFLSKYAWKPGMSGVDFSFSIGEKVNYRGKDGKSHLVKIESDLMSHEKAPGFVREVWIFDGPYGSEKCVLDADRLEPRFSEKEIEEMKER